MPIVGVDEDNRACGAVAPVIGLENRRIGEHFIR